MYHLELRMGVHQARAFNLSPEDLNERFLLPLSSGRFVRHEDRDWIPERTRVIVYEAPELRPDQMGMGKGWVNVQKHGHDVTERVLAAVQQTAVRNPTAEALKQRLLGRLAAGAVPLSEVLALAAEMSKGQRFSEQAATAELAVWDLLHRDELVLEAGGQSVPQTEWQWLLIDHRSWVDQGADVRLTR